MCPPKPRAGKELGLPLVRGHPALGARLGALGLEELCGGSALREFALSKNLPVVVCAWL